MAGNTQPEHELSNRGELSVQSTSGQCNGGVTKTDDTPISIMKKYPNHKPSGEWEDVPQEVRDQIYETCLDDFCDTMIGDRRAMSAARLDGKPLPRLQLCKIRDREITVGALRSLHTRYTILMQWKKELRNAYSTFVHGGYPNMHGTLIAHGNWMDGSERIKDKIEAKGVGEKYVLEGVGLGRIEAKVVTIIPSPQHTVILMGKISDLWLLGRVLIRLEASGAAWDVVEI